MLRVFRAVCRTGWAFNTPNRLSLWRGFGVSTMDIDEYKQYLIRRREKLEREANGQSDADDEDDKEKFEEIFRREVRELQIPPKLIEISYARSSGAGGQAVNKINSKAIIKMKVADMKVFGEKVPGRFRNIFAHKISKADEVQSTSDKTRDREMNTKDALEKMKAMIAEAKVEPREKIVDFAEESLEARQARIQEKRRRSEIKGGRRGKWD